MSGTHNTYAYITVVTHLLLGTSVLIDFCFSILPTVKNNGIQKKRLEVDTHFLWDRVCMFCEVHAFLGDTVKHRNSYLYEQRFLNFKCHLGYL